MTVGRYFAGSLLIAVLAGCGILIVGLLAGVPLAPVAAAWVMVTNLIPQVGGFLGGALFVLLGATQGPTTLLICLAWFLVTSSSRTMSCNRSSSARPSTSLHRSP